MTPVHEPLSSCETRFQGSVPARLQLLARLVLALLAVAAAGPAGAQPAPSFRSSCQELRASIAKLDPGAEDYFTIEVVGTLRDVQSDGVLAYMIMCSPPDPQVLCVTYTTGDRKKGDSVILAGTYSERGPDHVLLDPCLHHPPEPPPGR